MVSRHVYRNAETGRTPTPLGVSMLIAFLAGFIVGTVAGEWNLRRR